MLSTYAAHIITTGVGGITITNHADLHALMKSLMNHGRDLEPDFPVAAHRNARAFYVGSHPEMSNEDVDYVVDLLDEYMG